MLSCQYGSKSLRNVSKTLLKLCHKDFRQSFTQEWHNYNGRHSDTQKNKPLLLLECIFFIHINAIFCSTLTSSVSLLLFLTKPLTKQAASASSIQPQTSITEGDFEASSNSVSFNAEVQVRLPPIWTQTLDYTWKGWWKSDVINLPSSVVLKGQLKSFCWQCLSEAFSENAANVFSHVM